MSLSDVLTKMKFSPYTLLLLFAGVVVVTYVALGASLLRQHLDQGEISSQIGSTEAVLATAGDVRQDLEELPARLDEAEQELAAAKIAFPSELDNNNIVQTILTLAHEKGVRVRSLNAPAPAAEPAEETNGGTNLSFNLDADGDFDQLVAFLTALEEGATSTMRISTFALQEGDGWWVLGLELIAYARSSTAESSSPEDESSTGEEGDAIDDGGGEGSE